jgi:phosphoribosylformimino-5-aminoimidazole carboxamide ribonucleotide (ProFAR) isomerase
MQVIPAVDVLGSDAVRLKRGSFDEVLFRAPLGDLIEQIAATAPVRIHVVDLQGARDGVFRPAVLEQCLASAAGIAIEFSGGVRSVDAARGALASGAERVVVGTSAWADARALGAFVSALGPALVVACDVRAGFIAVGGWQETTVLGLEEALERCVEAGVPRLQVTAIERDGTMLGPDLELYRRVCGAGIPIVAAGGIRDDDDVAALGVAGCEAAIMGLGYLPRLARPPAWSR